MNRQPHPVTVLKRDLPVGREHILLDSGGRGVISNFCLFFLTLNSRFQEGKYREKNYADEGWAGQAQFELRTDEVFFLPSDGPCQRDSDAFRRGPTERLPKNSLPVVAPVDRWYRVGI